MKKVKAIASGRVQGVGFRMYTQQKAQQLGVGGYVRNLRNGDVEIVAAGEAATVDALLKWAESGSPEAVVNNLKVELIDIDNGEEFKGFEIRY
jgi:acylphosphatase